MTDPKKNPNKQRRSFFWRRKPCLPLDLAMPTVAAEPPQREAQPWYRPSLLKVAVFALGVFAILPTRANGQFGIDMAAILAALSKMQSLMNTFIATPLKTIMGRACAFVAPDGQPSPWLQSIDSIAVNGRHSIYLGESLIRVEMLRVVRTYELAITLHTLSVSPGRIRPAISSKMIFRGRDGSLALDLWKEGNRVLRGKVVPDFCSRGGETTALPSHLENAVRGITAAVCCIGCRHTHLGIPPATPEKALSCATNLEVGAPNWEPLERVRSPEECADFMYMGRAGEIELYKYRLTRRYLNIDRNSHSFYQYRDGKYVEITRSAALDHLRR
jgi:hypothetical protein